MHEVHKNLNPMEITNHTVLGTKMAKSKEIIMSKIKLMMNMNTAMQLLKKRL